MRAIFFILALSLAVYTTSAVAHSSKMGTMPPDGATVAQPPNELVIMFDRPARLTRVWMTHTHGNETHTDRIDVPKDMAERIQLTPESRGPGAYTVEWRAISDDGHAINGAFSFTVTGEQ